MRGLPRTGGARPTLERAPPCFRSAHEITSNEDASARLSTTESFPKSSRMYSPPSVDRIWGIWGSYYNMPKAIFYLLKGDYRALQQSTTVCLLRVWGFRAQGSSPNPKP